MISNRLDIVVFCKESTPRTVAIMHCDKTGNVETPEQFHQALREAVCSWVQMTTDGRDAYKEASNNFNLADLWSWASDPTLLKILRLHGILNFRMKCYCDPDPIQDWWYNDNLVNPKEVKS